FEDLLGAVDDDFVLVITELNAVHGGAHRLTTGGRPIPVQLNREIPHFHRGRIDEKILDLSDRSPIGRHHRPSSYVRLALGDFHITVVDTHNVVVIFVHVMPPVTRHKRRTCRVFTTELLQLTFRGNGG